MPYPWSSPTSAGPWDPQVPSAWISATHALGLVLCPWNPSRRCSLVELIGSQWASAVSVLADPVFLIISSMICVQFTVKGQWLCTGRCFNSVPSIIFVSVCVYTADSWMGVDSESCHTPSSSSSSSLTTPIDAPNGRCTAPEHHFSTTGR